MDTISLKRKQFEEESNRVFDMVRKHAQQVDETLESVVHLKNEVDTFQWTDTGGQKAEMRLTRKRKSVDSEDGQESEMGLSTKRKTKENINYGKINVSRKRNRQDYEDDAERKK